MCGVIRNGVICEKGDGRHHGIISYLLLLDPLPSRFLSHRSSTRIPSSSFVSKGFVRTTSTVDIVLKSSFRFRVTIARTFVRPLSAAVSMC
jgi:hypothetical protein